MSYRILILDYIPDEVLHAFSSIAQVDFLPTLNRNKLLKVLPYCDAILAKSHNVLDRELLSEAKRLKVIFRMGTGLDNLDLDYINERDISLLTAPKWSAGSVAEFIVMQILLLCRQFKSVQLGLCKHDYRRHQYYGRELSELSIGLLGLGSVGTEVAKRLSVFGCRLFGYSRSIYCEQTIAQCKVRMVDSLDELASFTDVLSIQVSLNDSSKGIVGLNAISRLKPGAFIVNVSRGEVIDQDALLSALQSGQIGGAALDVLNPDVPFLMSREESASYQNKLLYEEKIVVTPHIAAMTHETQTKLGLYFVDQLKSIVTKDDVLVVRGEVNNVN